MCNVRSHTLRFTVELQPDGGRSFYAIAEDEHGQHELYADDAQAQRAGRSFRLQEANAVFAEWLLSILHARGQTR